MTDHLINMQHESVSGLIKQLQLQQRFPVSMQGDLVKQLHLYQSENSGECYEGETAGTLETISKRE